MFPVLHILDWTSRTYTYTVHNTILMNRAMFPDLHILDWSSQNLLTAAVGSDVFLWNAATGDITQLFSLEQPDEYVSCVKYVKEGNVLAVGTSSGPVQVGHRYTAFQRSKVT